MTTVHVKIHSSPAVSTAGTASAQWGGYLLEEEHHVRWGENLVVAGGAFVLFWVVFILSWHISNKRVPAFADFTPAQKADWCSRINSTIHAFAVVAGVVVALASITWDDNFLPLSSIRSASFIFSVAIGYFACDLIVIIVWPVPLQWVFVVHHTVAVIPYAINNFFSCCAACQFGLLLYLLVELATLPLNVRGFLEAIGRENSKNYRRAIYVTYMVWAVSRMVLPIFLIYIFWAFAYPSDRNHDVCFYPNLVGAHIISLFCVGVFFFVHTPEMVTIRRERKKKNLLPMNSADASDPQSTRAAGTPMATPLSTKEAKKLKELASGSYDEVDISGIVAQPPSARAFT